MYSGLEVAFMSIRCDKKDDKWHNCCVNENDTLLEVMRAIDAASLGVALVVDGEMHLRGIATDGDIRRALMHGVSLEASIIDIMKREPLTFTPRSSRNYVIRQMQEKDIRQAPLIDNDGKVLDLYILTDLLLKEKRRNPVLLMAGGLGKRLRPLTDSVPKPLLKVGNKPIIETIMTSFIEQGFYRFYFAVNYKSEMIEKYFGDGSKWGGEICYLHEHKRLGTAGALYLLPKDLQEPIIVMNGDLLTKVDFGDFLDYHISQSAIATMGVREYSWQIPYGVIEMKGDRIFKITEKPVYNYYINAGMYVLSPEAIQRVSSEEYLDMPDLFRGILAEDKKTAIYQIRDYWMDIGQMADFQQAQMEYADIFGNGD